MGCNDAGAGQEQALSEVIGFVLIIGIIMAAFSLYLLYGVPVQGRENEINHMDAINDQFVSYKIGIDSLWTNRQTGLSMSTTFPLGTEGQTAQGKTSILPVLQPIGSSGVLAINQRTATPEIFTITSTSYITTTNTTAMNSNTISIPGMMAYSTAPSALLINISTSNASWNYPTPGSVQINGINWNATVNVTPNMAECLAPGFGTNVTYAPYPGCKGSDITVSVIKNGVPVLNRAVVYANITSSPASPYSVNLLDPAYGLQSFVTYPTTMTFLTSGTLSSPSVTAQYAYQQQANYTYSVPLGSLEYSTNNNYWIPQTYYYQMGGVFLAQSDGITYKLPPEIAFLNNGNGNITISIVALAYDAADSGTIGGSGQAQIQTSLDANTGSLPYAPVSLNTWNASINITTPDPNAAVMWAAYLKAAANQTAGIPATLYSVGNTTTGSYIYFPRGSDGNPHITLSVKTANLTASVQSVGSS